MRYVKLIIPTIIIIMILLPFTSRMLNYDDYIYMHMSDELSEHGLETFNQQQHFLGYTLTFREGTHSALTGYFYMLIGAVTGHSIPLMHIVLYMLFALSVIPIYMLLNHYEQKHIILKTLLLMTMPVLTVNVNSFMSDIPAFIMFIWGLALYLSMKGKKRYAANIFFIMSALFSYIYIVFPLLLYLCERNEKRIKTLIISVAAVILVFVVLILLNLSPSPLSAMSWKGSATLFNYHNLGNKFISYAMLMGLISIFILAIKSTYMEPMFYVTMFLGFAFGFTLPGFSLIASIIASLLIGTGIFSMYMMFLREYRYRNLFLWYGIFSIIAIIFFPMMISRYLLIIIIPVMLILLSEYTHRELIAGIIVNIIISLFFLYADSSFTNAVYRIPEQKGTVYFTGEWAFREHMEHMGADMLLKEDSIIEQGSIILIPQGMAAWNPHNAVLKDIKYKKSFSIQLPIVSLFSIRGRCGFYTDEFGPLPFNIVFNDTLYVNEFVYDTAGTLIIDRDSIVLWDREVLVPVTVPVQLDFDVDGDIEFDIMFHPDKRVKRYSDGIVLNVKRDSLDITDTILPDNEYHKLIPAGGHITFQIDTMGSAAYDWVGIYAREYD